MVGSCRLEAAGPSGYDAERPRAACAYRPSLRQASGHRATECPGAMRSHGGSLKSMQINLICARLDEETDGCPAVHSGGYACGLPRPPDHAP